MKKQKLSFVGDVCSVEYPSIGKTITVDCSKLPTSIYVACDASKHGIKQKLGDVESGKTAMEKYTQCLRVVESLKAGEWDLTANRDDTPAVLEAVCRVKGYKNTKSLEALLAKMVKDDEENNTTTAFDTVREWRTNLQVKSMIATIRAERAAKAAEESTEELVIPGLK